MSNKLVLPPQRSLGYQVRRCHRMFDRLLSTHLSGHDLNSGFWYYLRALWIQDGRTQKELSDITHVTENTTATMINFMVERGLVDRTRDPVDKRKLRVSLTAYGRKLQAELMHYAFDINALGTAGIPRSDLETCLSVLARVADNLESAVRELPDKPQPGPASRSKAGRRVR